MFPRRRKSNFTARNSILVSASITGVVLNCLPSLYSGIWVHLMGKLWSAYSSVQKFKEIITFFGSVILRDIRA